MQAAYCCGRRFCVLVVVGFVCWCFATLLQFGVRCLETLGAVPTTDAGPSALGLLAGSVFLCA